MGLRGGGKEQGRGKVENNMEYHRIGEELD